MKLSQAMLLGAKRRPQGFGTLLDASGATCAMGAAAEAVGILDTSQENRFVPNAQPPSEWAWAGCTPVDCPVCGWHFTNVERGIHHLNNIERWTRERIARWVEKLERSGAIG